MRSRVVRKALAGATLATSLLAAAEPADACHEPPYAPGYEASPNVGIFLGVTFAPKARFVYGVDVRLGTGQVGAIVRLEGHGLHQAKLVLAGTAVTAREPDGSSDGLGARLHGELGVALRMNRAHEDFGKLAGVHGAASVSENMLMLGVRLSGTMPFEPKATDAYDGEVATWLMVPGNLCLGGGRPVRDAEHALLPPARCLARPRSSEEEAWLAYWTEAARTEASSVPSFLRLAAELRAAGAPDALIAAASAAARDEERHAHRCAAEAGGVVIAAPPRGLAAPRPAASRDAALARLAVESWREGCIGEGIAATEVPIAEIARDEARHAELGWQILAWAWGQRRAAVRDAIDAEVAATERAHDVTVDAVARARLMIAAG